MCLSWRRDTQLGDTPLQPLQPLDTPLLFIFLASMARYMRVWCHLYPMPRLTTLRMLYHSFLAALASYYRQRHDWSEPDTMVSTYY